ASVMPPPDHYTLSDHFRTSGDPASASHLAPFDRRIDVAGRAARRRLLAEGVPGLERVAHLEQHVAGLQLAREGTPQLEEGAISLRGMGQAARPEEREHVLEVLPEPGGEEEAIVQLLSPADEGRAIGLLRQRRHQ